MGLASALGLSDFWFQLSLQPQGLSLFVYLALSFQIIVGHFIEFSANLDKNADFSSQRRKNLLCLLVQPFRQALGRWSKDLS